MMRPYRSDCVLLVIDVQKRIIDTIAEHNAVVNNIKALIKTCKVLGVPILLTEQKNLGGTVSEIAGVLQVPPLFSKFSFSCCGHPRLLQKLKALRRKTIIVCGIETHICVLQTVLDLLKSRYRVQIVRDATSSHDIIDRDTAVERMKTSGAEITTSETVIFELLERAGTEEFRKVLLIIKGRRSEKRRTP